MGVNASALECEGKTDFMRWHITRVEEAYKRYLALSDPAPIVITKKQYYDLFNDFGAMTDTGFLTLPLELYGKSFG